MKKTLGDIIILWISIKNHDHMMYGSWGMVGDRQMDGQTEKVTHRGGWPPKK